MKIKLSKNAEKSLGKIFDHTRAHFSEDLAIEVLNELSAAIHKLAEFPRLGHPINKDPLRRKLVVSKNTVAYEIVISKDPFIVIRNVIPRKTKS